MADHLTEEDLVLHFYGDGHVDRETAVDAHLQSCAACQAVWAEITGTLKMVDTSAVPEPGEGFEAAMWQRVQKALPQAAPRVSRFEPRRRLLQWVIPVTGLAAAAMVLLIAGHTWQVAPKAPASQPSAARTAADTKGRERVLLTALGEHFQRSELLLTELMNAPSSGAEELSFERQTADDLVESSRLYRQTAQQNGNARLAQMLEDLELVLVEIARSPERVDRKDLRSLQARIDDGNLLFKVRAVSKQIEDRQRSLSTE